LTFVLRLGSYWLQGENGWGERGCAREFTASELKRFLQAFNRIAEPPPARPDSVVIEETDGLQRET
jgi:hypothetical protein